MNNATTGINGMFAKAFRLIMRFQGAFVLAFAAMFWLGLPESIGNGLTMLVPTFVVLFVTPLAIMFCIPRFTPRFLAAPQTALEAATLAAVCLIGGMMFVFTIMSGVAAYGIGEPIAQQMAVGSSVISMALSLAMLASGLILLAMTSVSGTSEPARQTKPEKTWIRTLPPLDELRSRG